MNIARTGKYYFLKLLRLRGTPQSIAMGAAIGVFIGLTPTIPFHTVTILAITVVTRTSVIAALITSVLVCNPLTYIAIYYFSLLLGNLVTPFTLNWDTIKQVLDVVLSDGSLESRIQPLLSIGYEATVLMMVGGTVLALPFAISTYYGCLFLVISYRRKRRQKQILT
ncbi:MAG: DUF2062 domain-containing protein [Desulfofustis sp.]|nr:DUF2062 domain-containing protein [Desulfofustis sp.]NNF45502.1 DUF2062 domain-containing protein [Desulfofustis sp.]NNK58091.1 DUF2062 domain-containing protein [Desulfofustis sp.]